MAFFLILSMVVGLFNPLQAQTVALDISKAFGRVWHAGVLQKSKSYGISGQIFSL